MIYFYTNTKMCKNRVETAEYLSHLKEVLRDIPSDVMELSVMPSFTVLYKAREILEDCHNIILGAQNVCGKNELECTGEISAPLLKEAGVKLVMTGHSDRRGKFGETDEMINQKVHRILEQDMIVLFNVSETVYEKQTGITDETLCMQLKIGLYGVPLEKLSSIRILYEPAWAVGVSGQKPTADYIEERHRAIKNCLAEMYGEELGKKIPVIYGGSVNEENAPEIIAQEHVDGLGIGRSAWDAERFGRIIRKAMEIKAV